MGADIAFALLGFAFAYLLVSGLVELYTRRRRTKAWWTSRPSLKDWYDE